MTEGSDYICIGLSEQRIRIGPFPMTQIVRMRLKEDSGAYLFVEELPSSFREVYARSLLGSRALILILWEQ